MADILLGMACAVVVLGLAGAFFIERQRRQHAQELALTTKERDFALELATVPIGPDEAITRVDNTNLVRLTRIEEAIKQLYEPLLKDEEPLHQQHLSKWKVLWQQALDEREIDQSRLQQLLQERPSLDDQTNYGRRDRLMLTIARLQKFLAARNEEQRDVEVGERKFELEMRRQRETWGHAIHQLLLTEQTEIRKLIYALHEEIRRNPDLELVLGVSLRRMEAHERLISQLNERFRDPVSGEVDYGKKEPWDGWLTGIFETWMRDNRNRV